MKFKILDTQIYISFLFIAIISIMLLSDRTGLLLPSLFAVIMHELAHLFGMWILESTPKKIRLIPASVQIIRRFGMSGKNEIFIALCGPIANIFLFLILYFNYLSFGNEMTQIYALINLIVGVFNLLPVIGLDGGTVLNELLSKRYEYHKVKKILRSVTFIVFSVTIALGILMAKNGSLNISVFILGIYFFIMMLIKI